MKLYGSPFLRLATLFVLLTSGSTAFAECNSDVILSNPNSIYTDHGDGTITDNATGLMWMKCSLGQSGLTCNGDASSFTWKSALDAAQTANSGEGTLGYSDWRLPNIKELGSLTEKACYLPSINANVFPNTPSEVYWTATPTPQVDADAWCIYFHHGYDCTGNKNFAYDVRLVRGGGN